MEASLATKRISVYLVLLCWGFAVAMMHPSFATMVAGSLLLFMLFVLRLVSHFEGQYMLKAAEAKGKASVYGHLALEAAIAAVIFVGCVLAMAFLIRHVPWLWVPTTY